MVEPNYNESFFKIVYAKVRSNGRTEFVPLKLYIDTPLEQIKASFVNTSTINNNLIANRYLIQKVLGQGGFGRTYLATDRYRFDELCVLKEFSPYIPSDYNTQKYRDLFAREARLLYQIQHPQIPKFIACFEENERLFLVQEYIKGKTYAALLRERQRQGQAFSEAEVIQWLKDLLPVLEYIHKHNIIHRDISPDNIMLLSEQELPILIDFGIGKQFENFSTNNQESFKASEPLTYSHRNSVVGKIGYAPYEQICLGQCFPSSDIYALAVTAVVLLTGKEPEFMIAKQSLNWQWQQWANVSNHFAQILEKMMAAKPSDRYQSAQEVLADLQISAQPKVTIISKPREEVGFVNTPNNKPAINPKFVERCQQELTKYIGPIATFLISEVLSQNSEISLEKLVEILSDKIPNHQQASEFKRRMFS